MSLPTFLIVWVIASCIGSPLIGWFLSRRSTRVPLATNPPLRVFSSAQIGLSVQPRVVKRIVPETDLAASPGTCRSAQR
jgi:hypothetical protein